MHRKVTRVVFQDFNVVIQGIGTFQGELPPKQSFTADLKPKTKHMDNLHMVEGINGVDVTINNSHFTIPFANCKVWFWEPLEEASPKKSK